MAFQSKNLSVLAYANGFTLWHYTTGDPAVREDGYFDDAADMLRTGDFINTNFATESDKPRASLLVVTKNADKAVSVKELMSTL